MDQPTCEICEKQFSRKDALERHIKSFRDSNKPHRQNSPSGEICDICGKHFPLRHNLLRHKRNVHEKVKFPCTKCPKNFARNDVRVRHEASCTGSVTYACDQCPATFSALRELRDHQRVHKRSAETLAQPDVPAAPPAKRHRPDPGPSHVRCRRCTQRFPNRRELHVHTMRVHFPGGQGHLQPEPFDVAPWEFDNGNSGIVTKRTAP